VVGLDEEFDGVGVLAVPERGARLAALRVRERS
jgi:hypothetical protein